MPEEQTNKVEQAAQITNTVNTWNSAAITDAAQAAGVAVPEGYSKTIGGLGIILDAVEISAATSKRRIMKKQPRFSAVRAAQFYLEVWVNWQYLQRART